MKSKLILPLMLASLALFSACDGSSSQPATTVKFGEHCKQEYKDQYVAIEGYPRVINITSCDDSSCRLTLYGWPTLSKDSTAINIKTGKGKNTMDRLTDDFVAEDIKMRASDGTEISYNQPARFIGKLSVNQDYENPEENNCTLAVDRIEVVDQNSNNLPELPTAQEIHLSDFCDEQYDNQFVKMTGYLETSMFMLCNQRCSLDLHSDANRSDDPAARVSFMIGNGAAEMEELPKKYQLSGLKIHNDDGQVIDPTQPVTLSGIRTVSMGTGEDEGKRNCRLEVAKVEQ